MITLKDFEDTGALLTGHFRLSSGLHSDRYLQCARLLMWPERAESAGRELAEKLREFSPRAIVSPALGGIIIGHETARALAVPFLFAERDNMRPRRFGASALGVLKARSWPGNVRELKNLIERVLIMTDAEPIEARDLPPEARVSPTEISERGIQLATLSAFKEFAEREFLVAKLRENAWNISRTAEVINTPRSNLYKKIEHHKISRESDA